MIKMVKKIDKPEAIEYIVKQKLKRGMTKKEAYADIKRDQDFNNETGVKNRIKKAKLKKDPKEINKRFKEGFANLQ